MKITDDSLELIFRAKYINNSITIIHSYSLHFFGKNKDMVLYTTKVMKDGSFASGGNFQSSGDKVCHFQIIDKIFTTQVLKELPIERFESKESINDDM